MPKTDISRWDRMLSIFLLSLAALFWSGNLIAGRAVHEGTTPLTLAFWRWFIAMLVLLPIGLPSLRGKQEFLLQNLHKILILGISGISIYSSCIYKALEHTTALNAAILISLIPVAILLFSWIFYREKVSGLQLTGILLSLTGALTIISKGDPEAIIQLHFNPGDIWMMVAVPMWAIYTIRLQRFPEGIDALGLLTVTVIAGVIFLTPFYLWELAQGSRVSVSAEHIGAILYISVIAAVGAFFLWSKGVEIIGANRAGIFLHLVPVFAAVLAIILLGERFQTFHGLGIFLVFSGIGITSMHQIKWKQNAAGN